MCGIFAYKGTRIAEHRLVEQASKIKHRGPDLSSYQRIDDVFLCFHRLSIMDLTYRGAQPFVDYTNNSFVICNGEIYNDKELRQKFKNFDYRSTSDCEVLLPLISQVGIYTAAAALDAEFALVYYDANSKSLQAARDPLGIRPLFFGKNPDGEIAFASEAKALTEMFYDVRPFPPGHVYKDGKFYQYRSLVEQQSFKASEGKILDGIVEKLTYGVIKRLQSDAPVGFLLSGGLDSSLVCAIAAKYLKAPIKTFSIGSVTDAIDNAYAEKVARYIGAEHTTITFTKDQALEVLDTLIYQLETWDVTTIRASVGMYLVSKWIKENTNIKVLMTGEVSDELFGYKYTDFAPSPEEFQKEAQKRIQEIHLYDVLRADRSISSHALEARVPFGDLSFVDYVMSIPAEMKMNKNGPAGSLGMGKFLLRKAFQPYNLLPEEILFREKAAFSDAVGHSLVDDLKEQANKEITDSDLKTCAKEYSHCSPITKEGLLYRQIFEEHFPGRAELIPALWLPNKTWENCNVTDPSARMLPNYGKSGE